MSRPGKVSVIIPTFNRAHFLPFAIESVLGQTYKDYEIIVVDDGSTDRTREVLSSYLRMPNFRYIFQENRKQAAARNAGIRSSAGEYIAFLDSDDLWHPEKLSEQVRILDEYPDIGMVYSNQEVIKEHGSKDDAKYAPGVLKSGYIFKELLLREFYCSTPSLLIRRSVLNEVGLFDESLKDSLEDWELTLRISQKNKIFCVDKPLFRRRLHQSSARTFQEHRIHNHKKILHTYLDKSNISRSLANSVWAKAHYSWGRFYFESRRYGKALGNFFHALSRRYWATGIPLVLCLFGPVGKKVFNQLLKLRQDDEDLSCLQ